MKFGTKYLEALAEAESWKGEIVDYAIEKQDSMSPALLRTYYDARINLEGRMVSFYCKRENVSSWKDTFPVHVDVSELFVHKD